MTIKIAVSGFNEDSAKNERDISRSLEANPSHNGFHYVRTMLDDFKVIGPDGKHLCFVYEPMREPLWLFQERMPDGKIPLQLLKVYLRIFLKALDYLHSECHVIHTGELQGTIDITPRADHIVDLKMDNILVGFEDPLVLEEYVEKQSENPMPRKLKDGKVIYLSHNDFGPMKSYVVLPIIADFGLARSGDGSEPLRSIIQPPIFHAPEVILGTSWTYSTDIWNFGVLVLFRFYITCRAFGSRDIDLGYDGGQGFIQKYWFSPRWLCCSSTPWRNDCVIGPSAERTS